MVLGSKKGISRERERKRTTDRKGKRKREEKEWLINCLEESF
jgi:hypothetical protein